MATYDDLLEMYKPKKNWANVAQEAFGAVSGGLSGKPYTVPGDEEGGMKDILKSMILEDIKTKAENERYANDPVKQEERIKAEKFLRRAGFFPPKSNAPTESTQSQPNASGIQPDGMNLSGFETPTTQNNQKDINQPLSNSDSTMYKGMPIRIPSGETKINDEGDLVEVYIDNPAVKAAIEADTAIAKAKGEQEQAATGKVPDMDLAINLIDEVKNDPAFSKMSGVESLRSINPFSHYATVASKEKQIINTMSLLAAGNIKGQGSVTNWERDLLRTAATSYDPKRPYADKVKELDLLKRVLSRRKSRAKGLKVDFNTAEEANASGLPVGTDISIAGKEYVISED